VRARCQVGRGVGPGLVGDEAEQAGASLKGGPAVGGFACNFERLSVVLEG